MVSATTEVRAHDVRLTGQSQAGVVPSMVAEKTGSKALPGRTFDQAAMPKGGYSSMNVLLAQGQQQVSAAQIAQQALKQVGQDLFTVKRGLTRVLQGAQSAASLADQMSTSQQRIRQSLDQARNEEGRVLDAQLHFQHKQPVQRTFTIPGLNLTRQRDQSEQVRIDFPQLGSVVLNLDSQKSDKALVNQLDRALIPLSIRLQAGDNGALMFRAEESAYRQLEQQVMVTGQGHRYPAGQPNTIKVQPEPEGVEELAIHLGSQEGIRNSLSQVNQYLQQVQTSLSETQAYLGAIDRRAQQVSAATLGGEVLESKLTSVRQLGEQDFRATFQAVSAQANVRRQTVVALLR
ncbi:flagellin [Photobacterium sp. TY1-4]|uniref:flagellin n=1 Tax=Photobacterium sp. TY1-4 TaxID=2899122 RepID=UPI0021BEFE9F|nr:flagellin [Photobacterium sp. TY1-4]UXI03094.1 flagellin [Photobacterium sp. TY1-4]